MIGMPYRCVMTDRPGGPAALKVVERELRPPAENEACIRVLACAVCRPDLTARAGTGLYRGTPLEQKFPLVPGYSIIGEVEQVGSRAISDTAAGKSARGVRPGDRVGVLTVTGGYTEYLNWRADRLIPVPPALNPIQAAPIMLNYLVAYQVLHRVAKVRRGEKALIIGASGGIGTALLDLGRLAGLRMYGLASANKHAVLRAFGAEPIDYHTQDFVEALRMTVPEGIDVVLDGMNTLSTADGGLSLLRRGGRQVSFGEPPGLRELFRILGRLVATRLLLTGKTFSLYGTSSYFLGPRRAYLEDWAALFALLQAGKIRPIIERTFPILEAAQANALLESGAVTGNVVLSAPEFL